MPIDKVKALKLEKDSEGNPVDFDPTEVDTTEDYLAAKGISLENSSDTTIRGDDGVMKFKDSEVTSEVTLEELLETDFDFLEMICLLYKILKELGILTEHLKHITNLDIDEDEIEDD